MRVLVSDAKQTDAPVIDALLQMYLHDLSEYSGEAVGADGRFAYPHLMAYWQESERHPFLLSAIADDTSEIAGFALVRRIAPATHEMAEFFVLRSQRGQGLGAAAARELFDRFPERWRVAQEADNLPAQAFWRRVINEHTAGQYDEGPSAGSPIGIEQRFDLRR